MPFPPPTLPTNRANATPQQNTHPADHNAVNAAVNDIVDFIAIEEFVLSPSAGYSGSIRLRRSGKVVTMDMLLSRTTPLSTTADLTTGFGLGSVPVAWRPDPSWTVYGVGYYTGDSTETSTGDLLTIGVNPADGAIRGANAVTDLRQIRAQITWMIA